MRRVIGTLVAAAVLVSPALADILIGQTSGGQLKMHAHADDQPFVLQPVSGLFNGWADDHPALKSVDVDDPEEDLFQLPEVAGIEVELVASDPAFRLFRDDLSEVHPGERIGLGSPDIHYHPVWLIDSDDPAFDPDQTEWHVTLRAHDVGPSGLPSSDPIVAAFTTPEPATVLLLAPVLMLLRRRVR
ncbi:MAG: hypothetical protein CHACPFDD_02402 [Phycisphaerae bacterium]|nr:hypothetical protein [Phycisphaerae bacterium]